MSFPFPNTFPWLRWKTQWNQGKVWRRIQQDFEKDSHASKRLRLHYAMADEEWCIAINVAVCFLVIKDDWVCPYLKEIRQEAVTHISLALEKSTSSYHDLNFTQSDYFLTAESNILFILETGSYQLQTCQGESESMTNDIRGWLNSD